MDVPVVHVEDSRHDESVGYSPEPVPITPVVNRIDEEFFCPQTRTDAEVRSESSFDNSYSTPSLGSMTEPPSPLSMSYSQGGSSSDSRPVTSSSMRRVVPEVHVSSHITTSQRQDYPRERRNARPAQISSPNRVQRGSNPRRNREIREPGYHGVAKQHYRDRRRYNRGNSYREVSHRERH